MPKQDYYPNAVTKTALIAQGNVAADVTGLGKDLKQYKGDCLVVVNVTKVAGNATTLTARLQTTSNSDVVDHQVTGTNTGTGTCTEVEAGADSVAEGWSISLANTTIATVTGNVTGAITNATVGTYYDSQYIKFLLTAGGTAFATGDTFDIGVSARAWANIHHFTASAANGMAINASTVINSDEHPHYIRGVFDTDAPGANNSNYKAGLYIYGLTD